MEARNVDVNLNAVRHQLWIYKVDIDVLKAVLPEVVYKDWMVLCQVIDVISLLMIGCE